MRTLAMLCVAAFFASIVSALRADVIISARQQPVPICVPARVMEPDSPTIDQLKGAALEAERERIRLRESVKDLARCIERICGAKVSIETEPTGEQARNMYPLVILVGELAEQVDGKPAVFAPFKQGFRYVVSKK